MLFADQFYVNNFADRQKIHDAEDAEVFEELFG
jgi:hypothetical protein